MERIEMNTHMPMLLFAMLGMVGWVKGYFLDDTVSEYLGDNFPMSIQRRESNESLSYGK